MNRQEFGSLVRTLREEGKLSRTELAERIERVCRKNGWIESNKVIQDGTIEQIETGRKKILDSHLLLGLAEVFKFTSMESSMFFSAGVGIGIDQVIPEDRTPAKQLNQLVRKIKNIHLPVFIHDAYGDVIIANQAIIRLLGIPLEIIEQTPSIYSRYNVMRVIFSKDTGYRELVKPIWKQVSTDNMQFFRRITLKYRATPYFRCLKKALMEYDDFENVWEAVRFQPDNDGNSVAYDYEYPHLGRIKYQAVISAEITRAGELYSVYYVPANALARELFAQAVDKGGTELQRFASWPEKPECLD